MRTAATILLLTSLAQQSSLAQHAVTHSHKSDQVPATPAQDLPIRRVALYKNGVGFFEHAGTVRGTQAVTIDFTTAQLNDVLQTLTAIDLGGGHVQGAGYNSTTPLDQQLKALPLALGADPTATDLYTAVRGALVEVSGNGGSFTGRILNVEMRDVAAPHAPTKEDGTESATVQRPFLTVISDTGVVRTVPLSDHTAVHLLDGSVQGGVERYLQTLAANRQDGLRHLTLTDSGPAAARELRVSYISEVPVWKCTYRLLFDNRPVAGTAPRTATLQGWAVIDNTVGMDWNNVELSLIAGAPQSFIQPISQPTYTRRPEVPLPQEAMLTPQTHESGMDTVNVTHGSAGTGMGYGSGSGSGMGVSGGVYRGGVNAAQAAAPVAPKLPADKLDRLSTFAKVMAPPESYENAAASSIAPLTTTNSFDDYFEYKLTQPVTIRKNESSLVPILQTKVEADPVTLWSAAEPQPLRALWITNTSALTLDRGSFSILENGNFSGQGLLDPIHPGERRLLSYAADQAVHVTPEVSHAAGAPRRVQQVTVSRGVLLVRTAEVTESDLRIHNAAAEPRTVIVEQPRRAGWTLSTGTPVETTSSAYRYRVSVAPGATETLHTAERHVLFNTYQLATVSEEQLQLILRQDGNPATVADALRPVLDAKRRLAELDLQIAQRTADVTQITTDQNRLRENLKALKGTAEERSLAKRYTDELNRQEDQIATLHTELATLQQQQQAARDALATLLENLNLDVTV